MKRRFRRAPVALALPIALLLLADTPRVQALFVPQPLVVERLVREAREMPPAEPTVHRDIPYHTTLRRTLRLDIYEPLGNVASDQAPPIVVFLHGGSWIQGDKVTIRIVDRFLSRMRQAGYFVAAINYTTSVFRLLGGTLENTKRAIRWLAAHAEEYGYDPHRIGLYGVSAGGHLALMAASTMQLEEAGFAFVFAECAPTDLVGMREGDAFENSRVFRLFPEDRLRALSPITHVIEDLPPVLLFHGGEDQTVSLRQSERYAEALEEAGGEAEFVVYPEGDHAFLNLSDETWYRQETRALEYFAAKFAADRTE
ncbi:MAG: alpha/beta hydrolase [Spirochaetota bacterium]